MPSSHRKRRPMNPEQKRPTRRPPRTVEVRRTRQRALFILYTVLGIEILAALLTSPVFGIKKTRVQGMEDLPPTEAATVLQMVTIRPGANWFRTPVGGLQKHLTELPWVQTAQVSRRFPDSVETQITLRTPSVIVETAAAEFEVDRQGMPIRVARSECNAQLPHIVIEGLSGVHPGVPMASDGVRTAIQIFQTVSNDPVVRIAKILVDQNDNLCLNMRNGIRIQFGQNDAIETKIKLMRRALTREPDIASRLAEINLSCPEAPACTPRVAETSPTPETNTSPTQQSPSSSRPATQGSRDEEFPDQAIL